MECPQGYQSHLVLLKEVVIDQKDRTESKIWDASILFNLKVECWKLEVQSWMQKLGVQYVLFVTYPTPPPPLPPPPVVSFLYLVWKCCMDRSTWCYIYGKSSTLLQFLTPKWYKRKLEWKTKVGQFPHNIIMLSHFNRKRVYLYSLFGATFMLLNIFNTIYIHCGFVYSSSIIWFVI